MRWIKASDELPENNKPDSLKNKVKRHTVTKVVYSESEILDYDAHTMYVEGINDDIYVAIANIEWLDESAPSEAEELLWKELENQYRLWWRAGHLSPDVIDAKWNTHKQSLICKLRK